ncbi:hypothetical protein QOL99_01490 [Deinococcus sp. MIMF12]|uniref:Uncharacterized protein n=1 Tax=Deinococcus rhizophilus TaxID=3049544 RepID=A0ABT7JGL0_9DEIO|nr:hypothetical protein [Deinococcus rhizophilus]MDL2342814.1 hypothetical protein [Deinococcus rhizophilus]
MRIALPALLLPLLLAACGETPASDAGPDVSGVTLTVRDPDHDDTFSHPTTTDLRPTLGPLAGFPQSAAEQAVLAGRGTLDLPHVTALRAGRPAPGN